MKFVPPLLAVLLSSLPVWAQQEKFQMVETDRLILKNGNRVDGTIIGTNDEEVILRVKSGLLGVRKELIVKTEKIYVKVRVEEPKPEKLKLPPKEDTSKPVTPETPPTVKPTRPDKPPQGEPEKPITIKDMPDDDPVTKAKIIALLTKMRSVSDSEKQQAAEQLVQTGADGQVYLVGALIEVEELAPWILAAIGRIEALKGFPYLVKILPQLKDQTKALVFSVLASRQYKESVDVLAPYLSSKDPALCGAAVDALSTMHVTDYFEKIVGLLGTSDQTLATRIMIAVESMAKIPDFKEQAQNMLLDTLQRAETPRAKGQAALVAGRLQIAEAKPVLLEMLNHDTAEVRANAVMALGEMRQPDTISALADRLVLESDRWTKIQIIQALEKIKNPDAVPILIKQLADPDDQVRSRTSTALTTITGQPYGEDIQKWEAWYASAGGSRPK